MQVIKSIVELRAWSRASRAASKVVGLVPTMGALHAGHLSLVHAARVACQAVAVSIFVNPTQFAPGEDLASYPRTFTADCELLQSQGVDVVFAPETDEIYPPGAMTFVEVEGLSSRLDGASRPGHFRGVATVVAKLFLAAEPDQAFFGQKDAAQVAVLRRMVCDLALPVKLVVCPIVREMDGLALSSRNRYLGPEERHRALILSRALHTVQALAGAGENRTSVLTEAAIQTFATEPGVRVDYIAAVNWETLEPVEVLTPGTLFAVAACVGATRLIDNFVF